MEDFFSKLEPADIIGYVIGAVGICIAIYQTAQARNAKKIYQDSCKTRCKDLVHTISTLSKDVDKACKALGIVLDNTENENTLIRERSRLNGNISAILTHTKSLIRFCIRLNEEHKDQFDKKIYEEEELNRMLCRDDCLNFNEETTSNNVNIQKTNLKKKLNTTK